MTTVTATAATLNRLETIIGGSSRRGSSFGLGVIVSPGLVVGWRRRLGRGGGHAGLGLAGLAGNLDVDPLLRLCHAGAGIPLTLAGGVGSAVGNICIGRNTSSGRSLFSAAAVGQGSGGTVFNLGKAGVGNRGVSLDLVLLLLGRLGGLGIGCDNRDLGLRLSRGGGVGSGVVIGSRALNGGFLDLGI